MRVLIISHNLISKTTNMGKTLRSYFMNFAVEELAQFYIHSEVPVDDALCRNYFRFTDKDAIKSLIPFRSYGRTFGKEDIQPERTNTRTDKGIIGAVYQAGRKRTAGIYFLRNALWKLSRWDTEKYWKWVADFSPDIVFFASGDYGFMYDIARKTAERIQKPLIISCVDDYYLHNKNGSSVWGRYIHRKYMKTVSNTMKRAAAVFTICPDMQRVYEEMFERPCFVLHTSAKKSAYTPKAKRSGISYIGNLGYNRNCQLVELGRSLRTIQDSGIPEYIDVYSGERNPEILKVLTPENGIRFHGAISAEQVQEVMNSSMAVIHTESFDPQIQNRVRFSVSTKIAESLMNGPCLIAYGPEGIASIDYLKENGAAYTITDPGNLESGLKEILTNAELRESITARARELAEKNHSMDVNPVKVRKWLEQVCEKSDAERIKS